MANTVIGIFDNAPEAQQAVDQLISQGFSRGNIDLSAGVSRDSAGSNELIPDRHVNTSGTRTEEIVDDTKDVGSGIGSFFSSLFGGDDEEDTRKYANVGSRGSIVTVHTDTDEQAEQAADILDEAGAVDVNERAATYDSLTTAPSGSMGAAFMDTPTVDPAKVTDSDQTIKVIEENLAVGKRTVETGGVRLRSRIVAKPVEESIRLREERVTVNRTPVNRPATAADLNAFQDGQIELTEHAEVPVVSKTANVVEEISVGKDVSEREEVIRDTVRKTEVDVENLGTTDSTTRSAGTDTDEVTYSTK
ncbi:YsnF/AvaK domain-containing protein [Spirosoma endophyticum]|uniref:Conserved domain-containing protein n=1 Tax=Spirosoma endophyticum TaxID=662367 RepID=A0A1I2EA34_9BACT|nr:YsnF/AvaK domain-containing protein [Spirosoma endophyticum]SFE89715.1 conserved domain-containing protein [Spirosoma endophyticum]